MFHGSTPHGENITIYSPWINPSRGGKPGQCSTEQPTMGTQLRCCFLGATLLGGGEYRHGLLLETTPKRGKCMLRRLSGASPQTRGTCGMYTLSDAPPFRCTPSGDMNPYICRRDTPHIARNTKWTPAHLPRWDHPRVCREDTKHP